MSVKENKELIILLYEEALQHLKEDLENVKNNTTRSLILDEINCCEKRLREVKSL